MKLMMLWGYYPPYLEKFWSSFPDTNEIDYKTIIRAFEKDHCGWPTDLSVCLKEMGVEVEFVVSNCRRTQKRWALENGVRFSERNWEKEIALAQVKAFRPDVLWVASLFHLYGDFTRACKQYSQKIMSWVSCNYPESLDTSDFDYFITSHKDMLKERHDTFEKVLFVMPGFSIKILDHIGTINKKGNIFMGGMLSPAHLYRIKVLLDLITDGRFSLEIVGDKTIPDFSQIIKAPFKRFLKNKNLTEYLKNIRRIPESMQLYRMASKIDNKPAVFGVEYYKKLSNCLISLDVHGEIANGYAGNMRIFETTGVGTCLVTEHSKNIEELFVPDKEIVTFKSLAELKEKLLFFQERKELVDEIARRGQQRTLRDHSIEKVAEKVLHFLR